MRSENSEVGPRHVVKTCGRGGPLRRAPSFQNTTKGQKRKTPGPLTFLKFIVNYCKIDYSVPIFFFSLELISPSARKVEFVFF